MLALLDNEESQKTYRQAALFHKDTFGEKNMECTVSEGSGTNAGLTWRTNLLQKFGGKMSLIFRPEADLFYCNKLIPNGINIKLTFRQSNNEFRLMIGKNKQKVVLKILEGKFFPKYVKLDPGLLVQTEEMLQKNVALLPFTKITCAYETLAQGSPSFSCRDIGQGIVPTSLCLFLTKTAAKLGQYDLNPYNFIHQNLQRLTVKTDTDVLFALDTNFPKDYTNAYYNLYPNTYGETNPFSVSIEEFGGGYMAIFVELTSPVQIKDSSGGVWVKQKGGKININLTFAKPLPFPVDLCCFMFSLDVVQITKNRHISLASHIFRGLDK